MERLDTVKCKVNLFLPVVIRYGGDVVDLQLQDDLIRSPRHMMTKRASLHHDQRSGPARRIRESVVHDGRWPCRDCICVRSQGFHTEIIQSTGTMRDFETRRIAHPRLGEDSRE